MDDYGIKIGTLFFVGIFSLILTFDVVMGLQALYYWQLDRMVIAERFYRQPDNLAKTVEKQKIQLVEYRMLDSEKGIVSIPIARAMEIVAAELRESRPTDTTEDKQ